jgi:hypothetical protein
MHSFELGDKAFLKPEYCPILVVGRYEDFYEIQHEVYPDEIVLKDGETLYGDTSVEVIGDMDFSFHGRPIFLKIPSGHVCSPTTVPPTSRG